MSAKMRLATLGLPVAIGLLLLSCGSMGPNRQSSIAGTQYARSQSVEAAIAEIEAYEIPSEADAVLFERLRRALISELQVRDSTKIAMVPPSGQANAPVMSVADDGEGGWNLAWGYFNHGDYDQNGTVGISDITPIAMHFGEDVPEIDGVPDQYSIQAVIDGSGDDRVEISDITPLAQNFGVVFASYTVQGANLEQGPYGDIATVPLAEAEGDGRKTFSLPLQEHEVWVRVVAEDNESVRGAASSPIRNESPVDYPNASEGYIGSEQCLFCHSSVINSEEFYATAHMQANRDPNEGAGVVADFTGEVNVSDEGIDGTVNLFREGQDYFATIGDNTYKVIRTIGGGFGYMQTYVVRIGHSDYLLPIRWNESTGEWASYHLADWFDAGGPLANIDPAASFERGCIGCHSSTGAAVDFEESTGEWLASYLNLKNSCERCHGPGETHANAPAPENIFRASDMNDGDFATRIAVCAQCHSQGSSMGQLGGSALGYPWKSPEGIFTPGSVLEEYWELTPYADGDVFWTTSSGVSYGKKHVQQYSDYAQSRHFELQFGCWTCHDPHAPKPPEPATTAEANSQCYACHPDHQPPDLSSHTKHAETSPASRCVHCHMTRTGLSATPWDISNHTFVPIPPNETILMLDASSTNPIINSCMATDTCHGGASALTDRDALADKQAQFESFYGAG